MTWTLGRWRAVVYAVSTIACVAWTLVQGKDLGTDAMQYHLYLGFSALNDRFDLDFFGAGPQSYFPPYAYVPFYAMVRAGVPTALIATVLAASQSVLLWLTFELGVALDPRGEDARIPWIGLGAVAIAASNPVLLQSIGSTSIDIVTAAICLAGWLMLVKALRGGGSMHVCAAGVLLGIAVALKLSNAFAALCAVPMLAWLPGTWSHRARAVLVLGLSGAAAFALVSAPWSSLLWRHFGNPFFPFLNDVFRSPDFTTAPIKHYRFVPESFWAGLQRPFAMVLPRPLIHTELRAPDVRYALLALMLAGFLAARIRRARGAVAGSAGEWTARTSAPITAITACFVLAWTLWLYASGNSRYFIAASCVASVLITLLIQRIWRPERPVFKFLVLCVLAAQAVQVAIANGVRPAGQPWTSPWFELEMGDRFRKEPYLYVTLDSFAAGFLAPELAPGSGMMNISGEVVLAPEGPGGARAQNLIDRNVARLRMIAPLYRLRTDGTPSPPPFDVYDSQLLRFGLRTVRNDCASWRIAGGWNITFDRGESPSATAEPRYHLLTCGLERAPDADVAAYGAERKNVEPIFANLERACPALFAPAGMPSEKMATLWQRAYLDTDAVAWVNQGQVKYKRPGMKDRVVLGSEAEWRNGTGTIECSRHQP